MKIKRTIRALTVMLVITLSPHMAQSQAITIEDVIASWDKVSKMVIESAKLMPEEHYDFTPGEPLRNFANQINHTTASNIGFSYAVNAGNPTFPLPDRNNPPQDKATVVDVLEKSFEHFKKGLESLTTQDLESTVGWGPRGRQSQITRLKAVLIVTSHIQREHGKTMMYLRAKGIKPAAAGSW